MIIHYKINGTKCLTPCPNDRKGVYVGSTNCTKYCEYFKSQDTVSKYIMCDYQPDYELPKELFVI